MGEGAMSNAVRRLGIFGGSFDPVHVGHLVAAQDACEALDLDEVVFIPAAMAPLRRQHAHLNDRQRLELLRAAITGDPRFVVSTIEIDRGGVSYSIDTARELAALHPESKLFWIIGSDQALQLAKWKDIEKLGELVEFVVLARPGSHFPKSPPAGVRLHTVDSHLINISSTEIRERLAANKPVRHFLPAAVADLIDRHNLYRQTVHAQEKV
jgi:nicotinate-nucleotide adenylyltransferase